MMIISEGLGMRDSSMLTIYVVLFDEIDLACRPTNKHPSKNKYGRGTPIINLIISLT